MIDVFRITSMGSDGRCENNNQWRAFTFRTSLLDGSQSLCNPCLLCNSVCRNHMGPGTLFLNTRIQTYLRMILCPCCHVKETIPKLFNCCWISLVITLALFDLSSNLLIVFYVFSFTPWNGETHETAVSRSEDSGGMNIDPFLTTAPFYLSKDIHVSLNPR
jgi:hypothetical protein